MVDYVIRRATGDDYAALCDLYEQVDRYHRLALPHYYCEQGTPGRSKEYIQEAIESVDADILVANANRALVGMVHVLLRHTPDIPLTVPRLFAVVETLVVDERHRRMGIGQALMLSCEQWALARQADNIELGVWDFNEPALGFYEHLGFTTAVRKMSKGLG